MQDLIGSVLGHYRIADKIGAGGMGEVYRATDTKLGRDVALKVLPAEMASSPERLERFQREARVVAALNHPHIVTIHSVEEAEGVNFLTMELVEGQPLDKLVDAGALPVERIVDIGTAIADALAAAHEKGIVHRDLKPANVMVSEGGGVKVLDFGLAKMRPRGDSTSSELPTEVQTRDGVVMGTMPYMSPEQVSGRAADHRTDVFSLGVVLYEMASGRRPFQGESTAELASAILRDTPAAVTDPPISSGSSGAASRRTRASGSRRPATWATSSGTCAGIRRREAAHRPSRLPGGRRRRAPRGSTRASGSPCCRSSTAARIPTSRPWPRA
jgi:serine/threonine protein kinase